MARVHSARGFANALVVVLMVGLVATQAFSAFANHEPANKVAASSSAVRDVDGANGDDLVILSETIRVSSTADLILSAASECSLITDISTGNEGTGGTDSNDSTARSAIEYYITIDGDSVPVSTQPVPNETELDDGEIVFCDRLYRQSVSDSDGDGDVDRTDSYIDTRTTHSFNWLALNVGKNYDDDGDNVVDLELHAVFTEEEVGDATADALVGRTSLIIEPTNVSVHEQVIPADENA